MQLHDLYSTIMDLIGVPIPAPESSKSMLSSIPRDYAFSEHLNPSLGIAACRRRADDFQVKPYMQPCRCIIDRNLQKLVEWADGRLELYDLRTDFAEVHNLIGDPHYSELKNQLYSELVRQLGPFPPVDRDLNSEMVSEAPENY